jgi:hypothetical protein
MKTTKKGTNGRRSKAKPDSSEQTPLGPHDAETPGFDFPVLANTKAVEGQVRSPSISATGLEEDPRHLDRMPEKERSASNRRRVPATTAMTSGAQLRSRDLIEESRRVLVEALLPNPRNWRVHSKAQAEALRGLLREVGYADVVLVRELSEEG